MRRLACVCNVLLGTVVERLEGVNATVATAEQRMHETAANVEQLRGMFLIGSIFATLACPLGSPSCTTLGTRS